jgi:hypothetical protein
MLTTKEEKHKLNTNSKSELLELLNTAIENPNLDHIILNRFNFTNEKFFEVSIKEKVDHATNN